MISEQFPNTDIYLKNHFFFSTSQNLCRNLWNQISISNPLLKSHGAIKVETILILMTLNINFNDKINVQRVCSPFW